MSEKQFQILNNGQQVITDDFDLLGEISALADDRVLAELFRLQSFDGSTVYKGVLPYAQRGQGDSTLVMPNGASGRVLVNPFRAIVGSRTAVGTSPKDNWRDVRSGVLVGSTTLAQTVSFAAASVHPRWDLVYAIVTLASNGPSVTRKVKNPTTKVIAGTSVVTYTQTTVTLAVATGTPSATPIFPAAPADSGSSYIVPIAYVCIPTTYNGTYTFGANAIATVAPCVQLSPGAGGVSSEPADQQWVPSGIVSSIANQPKWAGSGGAGTNKPPTAYLPPTLQGEQTLYIALDFDDASTANHSHQNNDVIDSRDWRGRLCTWDVVTDDTGTLFPWADGVSSTSTNILFNGAAMAPGATATVLHGAGQSIIKNAAAGSGTMSRVVTINSGNSPISAGLLEIVCDHSDSGKLKVVYSNNPLARIFIRISFTAPLGPRTHV